MSAFNNSDRRSFGRRDLAIAGRASVPGRGMVPCVVRNVSDGGALITFEGEVKLPATFRLAIDGHGIDAMCEVRHSGPMGVGVRFLTQVPVIAVALPAVATPAPSAPPIAAPRCQPLSNRTLRGLMERPLRPRREPKILKPAGGEPPA